MLVGSLTLLALITMAIPVWRFAKDNLRQTRVLPGGETATLISWTYGKKHPLTMHDPMSPLWSRALPPPVLSELTTEEDRLVAWFKIDFPLADQKKSFRTTKFEVEAGDDAGQSVATVLHTSNSASVPRGNAVFTPFQIDAFPRSSKEIVIRFLSGANGLHADFRIANPVLHNYEIIAPSQLPAKACNGDLTVNLESLVSVKPQFIVDANGENRGEQMKDASGGLSNGYYVASGEERRVQPRFTCSWKDEHGWLGVAKRWRVTDDTGNFFGAGKASGSFLMPRLKENLKLEAWVSGPPVRVGFDGLIWDAGSVNIPEEMKIVSSKLNYSKQDAVIDRLQIIGKYNFGVKGAAVGFAFNQSPCVRVRFKSDRADDEIYLEAIDENGKHLHPPKPERQTDWMLPTPGIENNFMWNSSKYIDSNVDQDLIRAKYFLLDTPKGVSKVRLKFAVVHPLKVEFAVPPLR